MKIAKSLIKYLTLISMLFLFLGLAACKNGGDSSLGGGNLPPLKTPENVYLSLNQTADGKTEFILDWDKVKNAYEYRVKLNGKTLSTIKTECDVTQYVTMGKITVIEVWALGIRGEYSSSQKANLTCTAKEVSKDLLYTAIDGGYQVCGEANIDGVDLVLPDTYLGKPIIKIEDEAFQRNGKSKRFNTVRLPMHVNYIGAYAFASFVNLKELVIPPKVKTIGECAFLGCEKLTSVDLANVENLASGCFEWCDLREVFVPKTVKILGPGIFCSNQNLANVVLEDGMNIEEYGGGIFYYCTSLTSIPEGLPVITEGMFDECYALTDVYIPDTVKRIEADAFSSCNNLKSIHIPASVEHLIGSAFNHTPKDLKIYIDEACPFKLTDGYIITKDGKEFIYYLQSNTAESFTVPNGVETISDCAFLNAVNLQQISLPDTLTTIGGGAFYNSGLTYIELPDSVTWFGEGAFSQAPNLKTVKLGKGITSVCVGAFSGCQFVYLDIPDWITSIGNMPFYGCVKLEGVVLHKYLTSVSPTSVLFAMPFDGQLRILPTIYFRGTEAEWNEMMQKGILREELFIDHGRQMPIYFYSEEKPTDTEGLYWHYDENGMPVIWEIEK